jgi:hypothetical protein
LGHDLGLSVVGGSNLVIRGEIPARESVGGTAIEKTPLGLFEGLWRTVLNATVLAM